MPRRVAIIDAHPDPDPKSFCHALAGAYSVGAVSNGHTVRTISLSELQIPFLRTREEWEHSEPNKAIRECQEIIGWAEHIVIIYPLWLGSMPALLKAFLEQTLRPGFAIATGRRSMWPGLLGGRSARVVVTMGMPSLIYRLYFRAHSLKSLERNILGFVGIGPVRRTLIGNIEGGGEARHRKLLQQMTKLGEAAQ
jgi:putative NADPH-quinone reductase